MNPAATQLQPQTTARERTVLWAVVLLVFGLTALLLAALFKFNPAQHSFFPRCFFHQFTGLHCPGCGGQRAIHHLLHGDFAGALKLNALLVVLLPFGVWKTLRWSLKHFARRNLPTPFHHHGWYWAIVVIVIAFGVLRNLPGFAWLAP